MGKKELPVSDDMAEYFDAYHAALEIRDRALKMPFGYKKAYKAAKDAVKNRKKFWQKIYKVYPEVEGSRFEYNMINQVLVKKPE